MSRSGDRGPAPALAIGDDSFCSDCHKWLSEHEVCDGCGHYACDCICDFLKNDWPTHPSNPDRKVCGICQRVGTRGFLLLTAGRWVCRSSAACERRVRATGRVGVGVMRSDVR